MRSALLPRRGEGGGRGEGLKARVSSGFHHRCICYPHKVPPRKRIGGALWGCTALVMAHERQGVGLGSVDAEKARGVPARFIAGALCARHRCSAVRAVIRAGLANLGPHRRAVTPKSLGQHAPHAARAGGCTRASIALTMPWTHFAAVYTQQFKTLYMGGRFLIPRRTRVSGTVQSVIHA